MSILRKIGKGSLFIAGSGCLIASGYCITMAAGNIIKATASGIGLFGIAVICYAAYKITDKICKTISKDK